MAGLLDTLRAAILASGQSRRQLALKAGVAESALSRLMSGERGLSIEAAERLADVLGLRIAVEPKAPQTPDAACRRAGKPTAAHPNTPKRRTRQTAGKRPQTKGR